MSWSTKYDWVRRAVAHDNDLSRRRREQKARELETARASTAGPGKSQRGRATGRPGRPYGSVADAPGAPWPFSGACTTVCRLFSGPFEKEC